MHQFDHEKLDVYRVSLEFVTLAHHLTFPSGYGYLSDQLRRASTSVTLNIAEGAGEFSKKEKARFYRMARRSATECAAVLDVSSTLAFITPDQHSPGREILLRVVSMLVKLIVSFDPSGKGTGMGMGTDEA